MLSQTTILRFVEYGGRLNELNSQKFLANLCALLSHHFCNEKHQHKYHAYYINPTNWKLTWNQGESRRSSPIQGFECDPSYICYIRKKVFQLWRASELYWHFPSPVSFLESLSKAPTYSTSLIIWWAIEGYTI